MVINRNSLDMMDSQFRIESLNTEQNELIWPLIKGHPVFNGLADEDIKIVIPFFQNLSVPPGYIVMREGENENLMIYLIIKGSMDVIKNVKSSEIEKEIGLQLEQVIIAKLNSGDIFGELSFVKGETRSASIMSTTQSTLLAIDRKKMRAIEEKYPQVSILILKNIIGVVGGRLKLTSNEEVKKLRTLLRHTLLNSKTNLFFSYVIGLLCIYNLTIQSITDWSLNANLASIISAAIIVIFGVSLVLMIKQSQLPVKLFGITMNNWKPALRESMVWTSIVILSMIAVKWLLIQTVTRYHHLPLFDLHVDNRYLTFNFLLYGLHSPIQEFVARGVLQGSLQHFFTGKNVKLRAILVSNALFSATHVHLMSGLLGLIVFIPGLFWGWLYSRSENLLGVSLSHLLIGWTGLFLLNAESLF